MPNFSSIRITLPGLILVAAAAQTACDSQTGPGPEIHDTKYVFVDKDGLELPAGKHGICVLDRFTGLLWEVKSTSPGLHDRANTYSWFEPDEEASGELDFRGKPNGGICSGSDCDTYAMAQAAKSEALCGATDWRVPSRDELGSISDPRKTQDPPSINTLFFPHTQPGEYWSSNDYQFHWNTAWLWNFGNGLDRVEWKASPRFVRLVSGKAVYLERVED